MISWPLILSLMLMGFAPGGVPIPERSPTTYIYVSVQGDDEIAQFELEPRSCRLTPMERVAVSGGPASLSVHPDRRHLYVAQRSAETISSFRIDSSDGTLHHLNTISSHNPVYISTDRTGSYLLAAFNQRVPEWHPEMRAAIYRIRENGQLVPGPLQEIRTGNKPHAIATDPSNRFLYIPNTNANQVQQFRFDPDSGMSSPSDPPAAQRPPGEGPRHFTFSERREVVYFVNETNGSITAFNISPTDGALTPFQSISTLPPHFSGHNLSADIHLTPDERFLYATNRGDTRIHRTACRPWIFCRR